MPDRPCRTAHAGAIPADPSPPPFPMTAATATLQFHPQRRPMEPVADPIVGDRVELQLLTTLKCNLKCSYCSLGVGDVLGSQIHVDYDIEQLATFAARYLADKEVYVTITSEHTLPDDVRITAVRPSVDKDRRIVLTVSVLARGVDDVNQFMENLDQTQAFAELHSRQEQVTETGQIESSLEMVYEPQSDAPEAPAAAGGAR